MPTFRSFLRWFATFGIDVGNPAVESLNVGNAWQSEGNFDRAIAEYNEAIRLDPDYAGAYYNRGAARYAKKEYDKAIEDFSTAIRINPKFTFPYAGRGRAWQDLRKYELALLDYDEAIQLDPHDALNYANRGYVWHAKLEYDEAIADYSEALRLDASLAWTYSARGSARLTKHEIALGRATLGLIQIDRPALSAPVGSSARLGYDQAIEDFNAAIRIDSSSADAYCRRAVAWHAMDDFDRAIGDFTEAIRHNPGFVHALVARGHSWRELQQYHKAMDDFNESIRLMPGDLYAINALAWLLGSALDAEIRDGQRAVALAQKILTLDPDNVAWMDTLAVAYAEVGDFRKQSSGRNALCKTRRRRLSLRCVNDWSCIANRSPTDNGIGWRHQRNSSIAKAPEIARFPPRDSANKDRINASRFHTRNIASQ